MRSIDLGNLQLGMNCLAAVNESGRSPRSWKAVGGLVREAVFVISLCLLLFEVAGEEKMINVKCFEGPNNSSWFQGCHHHARFDLLMGPECHIWMVIVYSPRDRACVVMDRKLLQRPVYNWGVVGIDSYMCVVNTKCLYNSPRVISD